MSELQKALDGLAGKSFATTDKRGKFPMAATQPSADGRNLETVPLTHATTKAAYDAISNLITAAINEVAERDNLKAELEAVKGENAALRAACERIMPYLDWTIGPESLSHHPTMPSAVSMFRAALEQKGQPT